MSDTVRYYKSLPPPLTHHSIRSARSYVCVRCCHILQPQPSPPLTLNKDILEMCDTSGTGGNSMHAHLFLDAGVFKLRSWTRVSIVWSNISGSIDEAGQGGLASSLG